jgi:hypothetical protein
MSCKNTAYTYFGHNGTTYHICGVTDDNLKDGEVVLCDECKATATKESVKATKGYGAMITHRNQTHFNLYIVTHIFESYDGSNVIGFQVVLKGFEDRGDDMRRPTRFSWEDAHEDMATWHKGLMEDRMCSKHLRLFKVDDLGCYKCRMDRGEELATD